MKKTLNEEKMRIIQIMRGINEQEFKNNSKLEDTYPIDELIKMAIEKIHYEDWQIEKGKEHRIPNSNKYISDISGRAYIKVDLPDNNTYEILFKFFNQYELNEDFDFRYKVEITDSTMDTDLFDENIYDELESGTQQLIQDAINEYLYNYKNIE